MRTKKDFPTGKLRLKYPVSSFDANKKYTLYYEYSFDGAIIRKDTGYRVRVKDWNRDGNEKKGALRSSYGADYIYDNSKLITALFKYDSEIMAFVLKYPGMLSKRIIQAILNGVPITRDDDGLDFVEYVKKDLKYRLNANKIKQSRYENGLCGMNLFREFLKAQGKGTYRDGAVSRGIRTPKEVSCGRLRFRYRRRQRSRCPRPLLAAALCRLRPLR